MLELKSGMSISRGFSGNRHMIVLFRNKSLSPSSILSHHYVIPDKTNRPNDSTPFRHLGSVHRSFTGNQERVFESAWNLTLAVRRRRHTTARVHVRLRLQMTDDGVTVQYGHRPRVVLLRRHAVRRR